MHTIQEWVNGKYEAMEYPTMLEALADQRIMTVELEEGGFDLMEKCDEWFHLRVTPEQLRALGQELIALADTPIMN